MQQNRNTNIITLMISGLLAIVFSLLAIMAMQYGDDFMSRLYGFLALLSFGAGGINVIKKLM